MNYHELAYDAAKQEILRAKEDGSATLFLGHFFRDWLQQLPPEIADLDKLEILHLDLAGVKDLSPLSGLVGLKDLSIYNSQVVDLAPLEGLTALTSLDLRNTKIADLGPISRLKNLATLHLSNTLVADLGPIAELTGLTRIGFSNSRVTDITALAGLTELTYLYLSGTSVACLQALAGLKNLQSLSLDDTSVSDLVSLADLMALDFLTLKNTPVTDLGPIARLTGLSTLNLSGSSVTDLGPLAGLDALTVLNLNETAVADLTPLAALPKLSALHLNRTPIRDLSPLPSLRRLSFLSLAGTDISDARPIAKMRKLQKLDLSGAKIEDISGLSGAGQLEFLDLSNTRISDARPLAGLSRLRRLNLNNTDISDLRPLADLTRLGTYSFDGGLEFQGSKAATTYPDIAAISGVNKERDRARQLMRLMKHWKPDELEQDAPEVATGRDVETLLRGPILSDALTDVTKGADQFEATSLTDAPERDKDSVYRNALETLSYASARLSEVETANRIGRDLADSFRDYANFAQKEPLNPRLLNYLAAGIRAAITDENLSASLDAFDVLKVTGFLGEHDTLIRDYYPTALRGPQFEAETDPARLIAELFPRLDAAREILAQADRDGLFAPSVSDALEMLHRRAEGARKKLVTTGDDAEREKAVADLRRNSVLVTAYLGRIKGRLTQWVGKQAAWAKENPAATVLAADGLVGVATKVIEALTPVFNALWALIGNLPLPF